MKGLSVRQPWPWAILFAGKDIENRDWFTRIRGRIALHAAKGMTRGEYDEFYFFIREELPAGNMDIVSSFPSYEKLERGAIVGTVEIVDCVRESTSPWFFGECGFVLKNPVALSEPIPFRGALGFWDVPEDVEAEINKRSVKMKGQEEK